MDWIMGGGTTGMRMGLLSLKRRNMSSKILQRITSKLGVSNIVELFTKGLTGTDLQSFLLEVFHRRATR